ncbi:hypothetical protein D3C87_1426900 [compost metagenome]
MLQVVEVRRRLALAHAFQNAQMHLDGFLGLVEQAADRRRRGVTRKLFDLAVRQHVDIQFRPDVGDDARQPDAYPGRRLGGVQVPVDVQEVLQQRHVMRRRHGNAVIDDDGLDFSVQYRGQDGVFKTAHQHRLIHQPVVGTAQVT